MTTAHPLPLLRPDDIREGTVPALFGRVVQATPEAVAVRDAHGRSWTYAEIDAAAARFARHLASTPVSSATDPPRVGLQLPHGVPMIAAQLGALAAGWCYVPMDPTYPAARLRLMERIAELDAVITTPEPEGVGAHCPSGKGGAAYSPGERSPDAAAYILFTSGSTGRPKGVLHTHRSMLHGIANHVTNMSITPGDRVTVLTSFSFDMAVSDLYSALLTGATAVTLDVRSLGVPALASGLAEAEATVFHATPTVFRLLAAQDEQIPTVRLALLGGEPVHGDDVVTARRVFSPDCVFVNGYGFTEASFVLQQQIRRDDPIEQEAVLSLGRPLPGYEVDVEDVGADGAGELVVRSDVLARGYVGDPAQTRARFSADHRTYRPGDRVRILPDGRFAFAGRADGQVKVHGVRVELAEVQLALERAPDVARAVVLVGETAGAGLVAHVQAAPGASLTDVGLRRRLRDELPAAMIPSHCHVHEALPLTPTGKVDVRGLATIPETGPTTVPGSTREQIVLEAWVAAVGAHPDGLDVPFFDAGGGSLALARLHQGLRSRLAECPSPAALLGAGTVRQMARLLEPSSASSGDLARARAAARAARRRTRTEPRR